MTVYTIHSIIKQKLVLKFFLIYTEKKMKCGERKVKEIEKEYLWRPYRVNISGFPLLM